MTPFARTNCFNCAEGLRAERLARRLKGGGLAGEALPALKAACKEADTKFGRFPGETLYDVRRMAVNEQFA